MKRSHAMPPLITFAAAITATAIAAGPLPAKNPPNIIFILADDKY